MIGAIFAYSILVGLLVGLAAVGVERALGDLQLPRRLAWGAAYIAALLLPAASLLWRAETRPAPASADTSAAAANAAFDWDEALVALWVAATALMLAFYLAAWLRLMWRARRWPRAEGEATNVVVSHDVGPAVLGLARPRVVLPRWLMGAPAHLRQTVLAHERAHVAARDPLLLTAVHLVTILLPWNLPLWWFARRMRLAVELDCDTRVLESGIDASDYAEALLAVGERRAAAPSFAPAMTEPATQLERRIRIMLLGQPSSTRRSLAAALTALALAACATTVEPPAVRTAAVPPQNAAEAARRRIEKVVVGGPAVARRNADGTMTIEAPTAIVHLANEPGPQAVADSLELRGNELVFVGNVRFDFEGTSLSASRVVATKTADGQMTLAAEDAVLIRAMQPPN